jgi:tellurite resistance protein
MALSQNVVINFLTKFDKKGLERATKELKGFDKNVAISKRALKAGLYAGAVATGFALIKFGKSSIEAALAQEKLDKSLRLTLTSIGAEGLLPNIKIFIEDLQRLTNVTEDVLVPAFRQLVAQTGDVQSSQFLLQKSLDISAGSGAELSSVLDAITKAAVGNFKSIGSLGLGFTAAEAKAMGFQKLLINLDKYAGAAEASTQTFEGQLVRFRIAAGEASETLGQGFITAASFIATGSANLDIFSAKLENAAIQAANINVGFFSKGLGQAAIDAALIGIETLVGESTTLQEVEKRGQKIADDRYLQAKGYLGLSQLTIDALELQEKFGQKKLTTEEMLAKIQAQILARSKALTKEERARAALSKKKAELEAMFDMDRINLQAALSRKLNAEDELRVKTLIKLKEGTKEAVDEAEKYLDVLQVIADGKITTEEIEMLAKKWGMTTTAVLLYLQGLFAANDELRKMLALLDSIATKQKTIASLSAGQQVLFGLGVDPGQIGAGGKILGGAADTAISPILPQNNPNFASSAAGRALGLALGFTPMAEGGIVNSPTIAMIGEAGAEAVIPLDRMGSMGTKVTVNVAGSVISEGQLQSVIQDVLYNLNRTGAVTQLANLGR